MHVKQKCVGDIRKLLVEEPTIVNQQQKIRDLLKAFFQDPRTRHVYAVDDEGVMVGSIRLNDMIAFIMEYLQNLDDATFNKFITVFVEKKVSEVMLKQFLFVKEDVNIADMTIMMLENKINELPVVDDNMKIIGEVNMLEIVKFISDNEHLALND